MSDLCLLAISLSQAPGQRTDRPIVPPSSHLQASRPASRSTSPKKVVAQPRVQQELAPQPEFSRSPDVPMKSPAALPSKATPNQPAGAKLKTLPLKTASRQPAGSKTTSPKIAIATTTQARLSPRSGIQLYHQRLTSLRHGRLYTRLPVDSFYDVWRSAQGQPTYQQWRRLLALEARAVSRRQTPRQQTPRQQTPRQQNTRRVMVMVGDSLSQWYPSDYLPSQDIWLNQGISGDTTRGILQRLDDFSTARPDRIYVMAGVNDVKRGASDREILQNLSKIITRLQRHHPQAEIIVQSILPTRSPMIPNDRIEVLNQHLAQLTAQQGVAFLDLYSQFVDRDGYLQQRLSTDGIHLNLQGYQVWQTALSQAEPAIVSLSSPISNPARKPPAKG
ncbi:GDSL-type esterase/lipase family protein [Alkalinema sp. FACHB-956]|uniref:SGNH/GDSL hydrolase family protein n=1 Tax=Alkalinema sp. FACHB-956 TaxID=2692768 RepID=UPI0016873876|nr:GDSL-type esterase/lipase family protein [Alkalinema sp. FACHB-956]MBD2326522.1 lysophospholipase [Alkalinema sp. FACHB-956]